MTWKKIGNGFHLGVGPLYVAESENGDRYQCQAHRYQWGKRGRRKTAYEYVVSRLEGNVRFPLGEKTTLVEAKSLCEEDRHLRLNT